MKGILLRVRAQEFGGTVIAQVPSKHNIKSSASEENLGPFLSVWEHFWPNLALEADFSFFFFFLALWL